MDGWSSEEDDWKPTPRGRSRDRKNPGTVKKRSISKLSQRDASPKRSKKGKNKGQVYEDKINTIIKNKGKLPIVPVDCDSGFIKNSVSYYVEVKNIDAPDFGQKKLNWDEADGWEWSTPDEITELYDTLNVLGHIPIDFKPNRYTILPKQDITLFHKQQDQKAFEKSGIELPDLQLLYNFYARRNCHYIQVEGKGLYYLGADKADLKVPQFKPELSLRLRAKTIHSKPIYNYAFYAVIVGSTKNLAKSPYDFEELGGRKFPDI